MTAAVSPIEGDGGSDKQDIEAAVLVIVQEGAAVADGLQDVERALVRDGPRVAQPGRIGDVAKQGTLRVRSSRCAPGSPDRTPGREKRCRHSHGDSGQAKE